MRGRPPLTPPHKPKQQNKKKNNLLRILKVNRKMRQEETAKKDCYLEAFLFCVTPIFLKMFNLQNEIKKGKVTNEILKE